MEKVKIYILLATGVFFLSTSAIFVKLSDAPSIIIAFWRLCFTLIFLLPMFCYRHYYKRKISGNGADLSARDLATCVLSGLFLAVHWVMWFESLNYTSVASSTVLVSLQPLFSVFFGWLFLREKISAASFAGCLIAIAGSAVIGWGDMSLGQDALFGDIIAFLSAGFMSLHFFCGQILRKKLDAISYSSLSYASALLLLGAASLAKGLSFTGYSIGTWGAFVGLALLSTVGGQLTFNQLLGQLSATSVTVSILGEPVGTIILARILFGETLSIQQCAGITAILAGIVLFFYGSGKKSR